MPTIIPSTALRERLSVAASPKSPSRADPVRVEPDVRRLDVAVDDAERVGVLERAQHVGRDLDRLLDLELPPAAPSRGGPRRRRRTGTGSPGRAVRRPRPTPRRRRCGGGRRAAPSPAPRAARAPGSSPRRPRSRTPRPRRRGRSRCRAPDRRACARRAQEALDAVAAAPELGGQIAVAVARGRRRGGGLGLGRGLGGGAPRRTSRRTARPRDSRCRSLGSACGLIRPGHALSPRGKRHIGGDRAGLGAREPRLAGNRAEGWANCGWVRECREAPAQRMAPSYDLPVIRRQSGPRPDGPAPYPAP